MDNRHMRNVREQALESYREHAREKAYEKGVEETSDVPIIYVAPKEFASEDWDEQAQKIAEQIERQVPGATDAILERLGSEVSHIGEVAEDLKSASPSALTNIMVGDQEYCLIIKPNNEWDTKAEIVTALSGEIDGVLNNTPGTDKDWNRAVGNHEGEHCNKPKDTNDVLDALNEEARADRSALQELSSRAQHDIALAYKDMRHLGSASGHHIVHATGPLLHNDHNSSHFHTGIASEYKNIMDDEVENIFDWGSYDGDAMDAEELLKENPEAYFATAQDSLSKYKADIVAEYEHDPSPDNANNVLAVQALDQYVQHYEDAYRRRVLGQDIPEREPERLMSKESEEQYWSKLEALDTMEEVTLQNEDANTHQHSHSQKVHGAPVEPIDKVSGFFKGELSEVSLEDVRSVLPKEVSPDMQPEIAAMVKVQTCDEHLRNIVDELKEQGSSEFVIEQMKERRSEMMNEAINDAKYNQDIAPSIATAPQVLP